MSTNDHQADRETTERGETSITIDDAGDVTIPAVEVLTGRGFITGKSGSGKSNTASVVVEELLDRGFPVVVIDTDGEYWGLKEEYEILHVGADEECDLQVGSEHAGKLADLALEENVPIILDVSGYLDEEEADTLVRETARELFVKEKKLKKPFLMLVEECHEYIPEGGGLGETGKMLVKIGKRGRKHGLGIVGISQRPADVKKDFITQCDWLVWHRLTWQNDTKVVRRVVDSETADAVQDLGDGEAFVMADFLGGDVRRLQVRRKRTFDAGATPDLGEFDRPDLKSVSGDLVSELEEISDREERRQDRIAELEAALESREERIADLQDDLQQARDMSDMAQQFTQALTSSTGGDASSDLQDRITEIQEEKNADIRKLKEENADLRERLKAEQEERADLRARVEELEDYEQAVENLDELREAAIRMTDALGIDRSAGDERLRREIQQREERIEELRAEVSRLESTPRTDLEPPDDYEDFLEAPVVREQIECAKEEASSSPRYIKGVLAAILQEGGPVSYDAVAERLGVSTTTDISKAASELERQKLVSKDRHDDGMFVDLNVDGINDVRRAAAEREKAEELMESL